MLIRRLTFLAVSIAAVNAGWITAFGFYDFRIGPVHLAAHELFKPVLYLCAAVLAAAVANSSVAVAARVDSLMERLPTLWLIVAVIILLYLPSLGIAFNNNDWTHRADVRAWNSISDLAHLFVWRQPDGFYRPLVFVSLWIDYRIFGDHEWGYHIQNILFHIANCLLWIRASIRLGLDEGTARWSGLLFAVAAVNCEPVIWPGARFDLAAACFTLGALLFAIEWWFSHRAIFLIGMGACYAAALCSKESAYCLPLLVGLILSTPGIWKLPADAIKNRVAPLAISVAITIAMLLLRWTLFHGMGGYPGEAGNSPHFHVRFSTFSSFFTRALPVPLFALNATVMGSVAIIAILFFGVGACGYVAFCGGPRRLKAAVLVAALLSALPATNLVDWVGPLMGNTRYLYMSSLWIWLCISVAATGRARKWLLLLAVANVLATVHDYRNFTFFDIARLPPL